MGRTAPCGLFSYEKEDAMNAEEYRKMHESINSMGHDACGIGTIVNIDGHKDNRVLSDALSIVEKLEHRAGKDATGEVGDGRIFVSDVIDTWSIRTGENGDTVLRDKK